MELYKKLGTYRFFSHWKKRRTYICKVCGFLERTIDYGRLGEHPKKNHCGLQLSPLSHEQNIAANLLTPKRRILWIKKGGYILKGNKKKKRWIPVFSDDDINTAIKQQEAYIEKEELINLKSEDVFGLMVQKYLRLYPENEKVGLVIN